MKLAVRNISKSESHVTGSVSIDSNLLWTTFPFCSFQVCVDRVDGKSLEQYESDLLEVARERIAEIYKEIVCGGEHPCSNHDLEGRVAALEEFAAGITSRFNLYTLK
ncbi:hypothetical protein [Salmonella enterica]|uniref:hypothetical protein n=1 Tax=Salmonella enterica TaxID=28901 RepID=UPI001119A3CB|nr:hypothetical protein [Salmonella enterica]